MLSKNKENTLIYAIALYLSNNWLFRNLIIIRRFDGDYYVIEWLRKIRSNN